MRTYFSIIFILCSFFIFSQQKQSKSLSDLEVQYEYSFVRDTTDVERTRQTELMILDFNSYSSIFYSQQYLAARQIFKNATIAAQNSTNIEIKAVNLPKYKIGYSVYRQGSQIDVTSNINRDFFTFDNTYLNWKINYKEVKTILGYECHKATTNFNNRIFTAWYTKDIPISEGPYRFKGLTGLILEISDENRYHSFVANAIKKKTVEITPLQKGIPVTREQYLKKREEFRKNPYPENKRITKERRDQLIEAYKKDYSIEN